MRMSKTYQGKIEASPGELKAEARQMNKLIRGMAGGQMHTELETIPEGNAKMNDLLRQHARGGSNSQPLQDPEPGQKINQVAGNAGSGTGTRMPAAKLPLTFDDALREVLRLRKKLGNGDIDLSIKGR